MHLEFSLNKHTKQRHRKDFTFSLRGLIPQGTGNSQSSGPLKTRNSVLGKTMAFWHKGKRVRLFCPSPWGVMTSACSTCEACLFPPSCLQERVGEVGVSGSQCNFGPGLLHSSYVASTNTHTQLTLCRLPVLHRQTRGLGTGSSSAGAMLACVKRQKNPVGPAGSWHLALTPCAT